MSDAPDTPTPPDTPTAAAFLPQISIVTAGQRYPLGGPPTVDTGGRTPSLAGEARRWSYVLRSRERWRDSAEVLALHQRDAMATLNAFGLAEAAVRSIAVAGHVVVEMPWIEEGIGWAGRIFPWEFVLSRATRPFRSGGPQLTVMRHLRFSASTASLLGWPAAFAPEAMARVPLAPRVLFVQSLPGALADTYDAGYERERVRGAFGLTDTDARWRSLDNPTLAELAQACHDFRPQVVHFSGCDTHQGLVLLRDHAGHEALVAMDEHESAVGDLLGNADAVFDGCLMRRDDGMPSIVLPQALADALTAQGRHAPFFVGLNQWNSAARIAPLLLPAGVLASLGFQDSFDDSLAEYFFENLYGRLRTLDGCLPDAFDGAWAALRRQVDLMPGTGIALWARAPLTRPGPAGAAAGAAATAGATAAAA
ncbi:MAG: hypothetical protein HY855_01270, partial [Burkholderiales bacterium]|nr:hypothetical protein [Burkholderiales bacterium]